MADTSWLVTQRQALEARRAMIWIVLVLVLVLHDLNQAARYADHLIGMRAGAIVAAGPATGVITAARADAIVGLEVTVRDDPVTGTPMVVPLGRR